MHFQDAAIEELYKLLEAKTGVPPEHARLIHGGKEIHKDDDHELISDYKGIVHGSTLFMVMRLPGGSGDLSSDVESKDLPGGSGDLSSDVESKDLPGGSGDLSSDVQSKDLDELAPLTNEPDMITWDDDPLGKRAKMPCGHAIGPESLTAYCRSLLSAGKYQFLCPYVSTDGKLRCNKEWSYIEVRRFGVLNKIEQKDFETRITENYLRKAQGIQECPGCNSLCMRKNPKDKRLICILCTKDEGKHFEFCWNCLHEWKLGGTDKCGNEECDGEDPRLKILREAPQKKVVGVNTPSTRACPSCGSLIYHTEACKHMVCPCGTNFCFICLGIREGGPSGAWNCGSFNSKCKPVDRQTSIPGQ